MLPSTSKFLPCAQSFGATYGAVTPGEYDFGTTANARRRFQQIFPNRLYCIEIMNTAATAPEAAYQSNIIEVPKILFGLETTDPLIFGRAYEIGNYLINNSIRAFFYTDQAVDYLVGTVTGRLGQDASLVGFPSLQLKVNLNLFEIVDKKMLMEFQDSLGTSTLTPAEDVPPELENRV